MEQRRSRAVQRLRWLEWALVALLVSLTATLWLYRRRNVAMLRGLKHPVPERAPAPHRGFTLIELGVTIAVIALAFAIAVPTMSSLTRAQLKQKTGQLAGGIRALYGATALAGHSCRLVLDLDEGAYWSECAKEEVRLPGPEAREESDEDLSRDDDHLTEAQKLKKQIAQRTAFAPSKEIPRTELGRAVKLHEVWVQHQAKRLTQGRAYLYFWPSGLTEAAGIQLKQGDDVYSLLVTPLTGRVRVLARAEDAPGEP